MKKSSRRSVHIMVVVISYILTVTLIFCGLYRIMHSTGVSGESPLPQLPIVGGLFEPSPPSERKPLVAVWIATVSNINYPTSRALDSEALAGELDAIVDNTRALGANAVFFQVRPSGDALYDSSLFPSSHYVSGSRGEAADGGFDSLRYLVERAHAQGIAVHAWVNPVRVLPGSVSDPARRDELCSWEAAAVHPEWTVIYEDGRMYYDIGIPEVRALIADGVSEIVREYDVDGVVFDDYFYPYPVRGNDGRLAAFDDSATYASYGGALTLSEFRRESVRALVRKCSLAAKKADSDCLFGISPFGIWKNAPSEGGAGTSGLEGYYDIYCDAVSFAQEQSVDYIAPQLYWGIGDESADFLTLASWWREQLADSGTAFVPCIAAYRYESGAYSEGEISRQIEYIRSLDGYCGVALYGYSALIDPRLSVGREVRAALVPGEAP